MKTNVQSSAAASGLDIRVDSQASIRVWNPFPGDIMISGQVFYHALSNAIMIQVPNFSGMLRFKLLSLLVPVKFFKFKIRPRLTSS